jgi:hypothetical protein
MKKYLLFLALIGNLTLTAQTWTGSAGDNLWASGGNWSGGVAPTSSSNVVFSSSPAANVTLPSGNTTIGNISLTGTTTVTLIGPAAVTTLTLSSGTSNIASNCILAFQGNSGTNTASLAFSSGSLTVASGGTLRCNVNSFVASTTTSQLNFQAGSTFNLNRAGGEFPIGTYAPTSLSSWKPLSGTVASVPNFKMSSSTGSYGNVEFDVDLASTGRAFASTSAPDITMNDLTFTRTANAALAPGELRISNSTPAAGYVLWTVNGNLTITAAAKLGIMTGTTGSARLVVKGTITNNGAIVSGVPTDPNIAELQMDGTATPYVSGVAIGNNVTVVLNYPSGLTLSQSVTYPKVRLVGKVILGNNNFTISQTGNNLVTGTGISAYFVTNGTGKLILPYVLAGSNRTFHVGASDAANDYSQVNITTSSSATDGSIGVRVFSGNSVSSTNGKVLRTWDITSETGSGHTVSALTFNFREDQCQAGFNFSSTADIYHNGAALAGATGLTIGGTSPSRNIAATGLTLTSFSPFTVVSSVVVPVELTYFKGKNTEGGNLLTWQTAQEQNNSHFDIERSADGSTFHTIGQTKGKGTTAYTSDYNFTDNNPFPIAYYRLRQVDFSGKTTLSQVITLKSTAKNGAKIYPSVTSDFLMVDLPANTEAATAMVTDLLGRPVLRQNVVVGQQISVSNLTSGQYFITIEAKGLKTTARFIKN